MRTVAAASGLAVLASRAPRSSRRGAAACRRAARGCRPRRRDRRTAVSATLTASPVPRWTRCSTNSTGTSVTSCSCSVFVTRSAPWPTTTTIRSSGSSASASTTCSTIGRPQSGWRTLGVSERMRVPSPAARTTADSGRYWLMRSPPAVLAVRRTAEVLGLGGEASNLDLGLQRTLCCRYTTPDRPLTIPPRVCDRGPHNVTGVNNADSFADRHGLTDQEAPQAHAQEEAQEAAEEDPLAAPSAGPLALAEPGAIRTPFGRPVGRPNRAGATPRRLCRRHMRKLEAHGLGHGGGGDDGNADRGRQRPAPDRAGRPGRRRAPRRWVRSRP